MILKQTGYIYIWESLSKKRYVGQTTDSISNRWRSHCNAANNFNHLAFLTPLSRGIRQHSGDFKLVFSLQCDVEDLDFYETKFINELNTLFPNGYNALPGGRKINRCMTRVDEETIEDHALGLSTYEAAEKRGVTSMGIVKRRQKLGLISSNRRVSSFTLEDVQDMQRLSKNRVSQRKIAELYNTSNAQVSRLIKGHQGPLKHANTKPQQ